MFLTHTQSATRKLGGDMFFTWNVAVVIRAYASTFRYHEMTHQVKALVI